MVITKRQVLLLTLILCALALKACNITIGLKPDDAGSQNGVGVAEWGRILICDYY